jgi:GNAT superfamily N-acetyltransferase
MEAILMNEILQDLSTPNLVSAIENNVFSMFQTFRDWPRAEVHDEATILWNITDIPFALFNSISRAQLPPEEIDATIQSIIAQAKLRGVPLLWWTGPATRPADLEKHLERHGFVNDGQMPGMAVDLANLNTNLPMPPGFSVQRVKDDASLNLWSKICAAGFGLPDFVADAFCDFMRYVDTRKNRAYLGWLNGKPVATSLLVLGAGVAGIYNVVTIPEARRQGIGAKMTEFPLLEARALGYRAGILQASKMGAPVYRSLGFQEYCKIGQLMWMPEQTQRAG